MWVAHPRKFATNTLKIDSSLEEGDSRAQAFIACVCFSWIAWWWFSKILGAGGRLRWQSPPQKPGQGGCFGCLLISLCHYASLKPIYLFLPLFITVSPAWMGDCHFDFSTGVVAAGASPAKVLPNNCVLAKRLVFCFLWPLCRDACPFSCDPSCHDLSDLVDRRW